MYLDTSILVSLLLKDRHTARARVVLRANPVQLLISDFGAAEFCSAVNRRVRTQELTIYQARLAFEVFDRWTAQQTSRLTWSTLDVAQAETLLRRLDLPLKAPDAIHIAAAHRLGAVIATFDDQLARSAKVLGVPTIEG